MKNMSIFDNTEERFRKHYYMIKDFLTGTKNMCALVGPRKVGKTYLLHQIAFENKNAIYVDFKQVADPDDQDEIFSNIIKSISEGQTTIWLLDEITYCELFDCRLNALAERLVNGSPVKIIVTGSQQTAIETSVRLAFSIKAEYVRMSFLSFYEYIMINKFHSKYHEISLDTLQEQNVAEDDFKDYVMQKYSLERYVDLKSYVSSCLDETVVSNLKSSSCLVSDMSDVSAEDVIRAMYAILYKLHNRCNAKTFMAGDHVKKITSDYNLIHSKIKRNDLLDAYEKSVFYQYQLTKMVDKRTFRKIILFLKEIDFIYVEASNIQDIVNWSKYKQCDQDTLSVDDFFSRYNVCFKYPFFYYALVEEIISKLDTSAVASDFLFGSLYGSMIECAVKGALADYEKEDVLLELRDTGYEVDYFSGLLQLAVEISIRDKDLSETNFNHFSEITSTTQKYLLGRNTFTLGDVNRIPYYLFILYIENL